MSDMTDNTWYCDHPNCDFHIGKMWGYRINEHRLEHDRADLHIAGELAKAQAETQLWKARLFDLLYDTLGPTRARAQMEKYEKGLLRG